MESLATWFANTLGQKISAEAVIFIVSMIPILECRGGLLVASLLKVNIWRAVPICILGNVLPIPFLLLFIRRIFTWFKKFRWSRPLVEKLENRARNKSKGLANGEFAGLMLFVGVPLPGTGGWTGALVASLMEMDFKRAILSIFLGILIATLIMTVVSYGALGSILH